MITPGFSLTATERVLPKLALDFTTASLDSRITFTRTTDATHPATYVNSSGYIASAADNTPRFDYTLNTGGACKGLLIEESRANLALYSSDLTQTSSWLASNVTTAKTATGPDNVANSATTVTSSGTNSAHIQQKIVSASASKSSSVYVKRKTGTGTVLFSQGEITGSNFVVNGDFATGDLTGWSTSVEGSWGVVSNQMVCTGSTINANYAIQTISGFTVGKLYVFECSVLADSNPARNGSIYISTTGAGTPQVYAWKPSYGLGTFKVAFVAASTTMAITVQQFTSCSRTYDNFTIYEMVSTDVTSNIASNWYRASTTGTVTNPVCTVAVLTNGDAVDVYGVQCEAGAFATSYIPTTTTALTRNADVATMTGTNFSDWFNATQGTFVSTICPFALSGAVPSIWITQSSSASYYMGVFTDPTLQWFVKDGTAQAVLDAGAYVVNTFTKQASSYKTNNFACALNGGNPATDVSGTVPSVNELRFCAYNSGVATSGIIKNLYYYPQCLTNAEIQAFSK